jgi:hypothetical protein
MDLVAAVAAEPWELVAKAEMVPVGVAETDPPQLHLNEVLHHAVVVAAAETGLVLEPQHMAETEWSLFVTHPLLWIQRHQH